MFIEQINFTKSELKVVRTERDSLKEIVEQQVSARSSDRKRCRGSSTVSDVSLRYLGITAKCLSKLPAYCAKETSELCSFSSVSIRRWSSWADIITDNGVPSLAFSVARYPGEYLISFGGYYRPSFHNEVNFLKKIV